VNAAPAFELFRRSSGASVGVKRADGDRTATFSGWEHGALEDRTTPGQDRPLITAPPSASWGQSGEEGWVWAAAIAGGIGFEDRVLWGCRPKRIPQDFGLPSRGWVGEFPVEHVAS
jgi:hypothetical protein